MEDPRNSRLLFAGTEFGLYWSVDGGRHWTFPGGALPHVMVDRTVINGDLVLGTHGRGVIILDDIAPLETWDASSSAAEVQLFPVRDAMEVYQWRDLPLPGARTFLAPNKPLGALITYYLAKDADSSAAIGIRILGADNKVVREMTGPATRGMHRVEWDLRTQFAFVPPPEDSGYYGPPRSPYVPPGDYTIELIARGTTLKRTMHVRADPRVNTTPEALRARWNMMTQIDSTSRYFADQRRTFVAVDSEYTRLVAALGANVPADSLVSSIAATLTTLRARFGHSYPTPIGQAFDLLGGLESSSAAPTEAEQRTLDVVKADLNDAYAKLQALIATQMPRLRELVRSRTTR